MNWEIVGYILAIVFAIGGVSFALKWKQAVNVLRQLGEAFTKTADVCEDRQVTKQEALDALKEWVEAYEAIMKLIGRK